LTRSTSVRVRLTVVGELLAPEGGGPSATITENRHPEQDFKRVCKLGVSYA